MRSIASYHPTVVAYRTNAPTSVDRFDRTEGQAPQALNPGPT